MRRGTFKLLLVVMVAALMTAATGSPALAAKRAHLKLVLDKQTSSIYLFNPFQAGEVYVPAVSVTATLTGCSTGADNYAESTTLTQDGHVLAEWGGHPGSGLASCTDPSGSPVSTDPLLAMDGFLHPGRARVTMTVRTFDDSASVTVTRWVTIPASCNKSKPHNR
jgi:hypothetical protein